MLKQYLSLRQNVLEHCQSDSKQFILTQAAKLLVQ